MLQRGVLRRRVGMFRDFGEIKKMGLREPEIPKHRFKTLNDQRMAKTFRLEVVTPDRVVLADDEVISLIVPGAEGYLGIMAGHAPFFGEMRVGEIIVRHDDGREEDLATSGGFIEVQNNRATLLVDSAEHAYEIDLARAEAAKRRAEGLLARAGKGDVDVERARAALERAINRLRVAGRVQ